MAHSKLLLSIQSSHHSVKAIDETKRLSVKKSSDVQELNAATFSLIMIWFLSVPNAATATLLAKIELIFRFIPAT